MSVALVFIAATVSAQTNTEPVKTATSEKKACFVDVNNNGTCDLHENGTCKGNGARKGTGNCNGKGVQRGQGNCNGQGQGNVQGNGQGRGQGNGQGNGQGKNFVDANKNGVCDINEARNKK